MKKVYKYGHDWTWEELTVVNKVASSMTRAHDDDGMFVVEGIRGAISSECRPEESSINEQKDIDMDNEIDYPADIQVLMSTVK